MKKELINTIEQGMLGILNNEQLAKLHEVLELSFTMFAENRGDSQQSNDELLKLFLSAKQVEGCSERSLKYYRTTLSKMIVKIDKSVRQVETNDIRAYISDYENESNAGKVTLDNIRRIISSFFAWLEDENYIVKSPARRIHKIRVGKTVKDVYSDEELEQMRDTCTNLRDLAIIDVLSSTWIRVGELVAPLHTDRADIKMLSIDSYITTDNMLQNRRGITTYTGTFENITAAVGYYCNDILVSNIRPYLKKIWLSDRNGGCSPDILVFRVTDESKFLPIYVYYALYQDDFFDFMMDGKKGLKMPRGDKNSILNYQIPNVAMPQQKVFADYALSCDKLKFEAHSYQQSHKE